MKTYTAIEGLAELVDLIDKGTISNNIGKQIIMTILETGESAKSIVEKQGLSVISDDGAIREIAQKIIDANPNQTSEYRSGKDKLFGFFVGQVMKETKGRANPQMINDILKELLG